MKQNLRPNAINWNNIEDDVDLQVWNRLTANFWLPEKVPLSNDIPSWKTLTPAQQELTIRVFTGLTLLDTLQSVVGAPKLIEDAVTDHEQAVYSNIGFMECYTEGHEVLTIKGWKDISKVTYEDKVAQYNKMNGKISFANPKTISSHFAEKIYSIQSQYVNLEVSGGHRLLFKKKNEPLVMEAKDFFEKPNISFINHIHAGKSSVTGRGMTAKERLLVAIHADGSYDKTKNSQGEILRDGSRIGAIPAKFSFSKEGKIERLISLAKEVGWRLEEHATKEAKGNIKAKRVFYLYVPVSDVILEKNPVDLFGYEKSLQWCQDFVQEVGYWDSHISTTCIDHITYTNTDEKFANYLVAIASMAGYRTWIKRRRDNRSEVFNDTLIVSINRNTFVSSTQRNKLTIKDGQQVYGIEVPDGFLLIRNGGKVIVSGNCVHAKSYSSIFSTLCTTEQITETYNWAEHNKFLNKKEDLILSYYNGEDPLKKKAASVILESFLFYSGFYWPMYLSSRSKLTNTADLIRLIIRDEAVHGYYIGYKFQQEFKKLSLPKQLEIEDFTKKLLVELYANEVSYTESLYDAVGLTEEVKVFLHYNANKALNNLGFEGIFTPEQCEVNPAIMASLSPESGENHDFFSGSGASYVIGTVTQTQDEDWDF